LNEIKLSRSQVNQDLSSYVHKKTDSKIQDAKGKNISIPADPNVKLSRRMSPSNDIERFSMSKVAYSELIRLLQFLTNVTRFDIAFIVTMLSRYLQNPGLEHWNAAKRVLRYLKKICDKEISFNNMAPKQKCICYSDTDFAGDEDKRRSITGYIVVMNGVPVVWASRRQKIVTLSTAKVKLMVALQAAQEAEC